jgi:hypothetical protein
LTKEKKSFTLEILLALVAADDAPAEKAEKTTGFL